MNKDERFDALIATLTNELGRRIEQAAGEPLPYALIVLGSKDSNTPALHIVSNETAGGLYVLSDLLREFSKRRQSN
jgi:hypothetical protein